MKITNKQFLVLISGYNMNNIHLSRKFALWHNSTLVSEAEEEILKRSESGGRNETPEGK